MPSTCPPDPLRLLFSPVQPALQHEQCRAFFFFLFLSHKHKDIHTWSTWGMPPQSAIWREEGKHKRSHQHIGACPFAQRWTHAITPHYTRHLPLNMPNTFSLLPPIGDPLDPEQLTPINGTHFSSNSRLVSVEDHKRLP